MGASSPPSVLLVGCGRMGSALLTGWEARGTFGSFTVVEPTPPAGVEAFASFRDLPADCHPHLVVFAVKPQQLEAVMQDYAASAAAQPVATPPPVFLSIAAGKPLASLERGLAGGGSGRSDLPVVRAMPNTPAAIGQGVTVAVANPHVSTAGRALVSAALEAVGAVFWVEDEALMDAVTALSGSGPAYVFLLVECLTAAGLALGLPAALAKDLARRTVTGSGALLAATPDASPAALRQSVTSPGGTTEAALTVLMQDDRLPSLFRTALDAACRRSRELAG